ncbi:MAG: two-component system, cell cycle sensor histidine kinase and response regulator CckA [Acidobacteriota bacterium]|jgi:PAS domain S-box-containing protein|nr:two-component system, cell cycle sensor histidine kinase and response regulator CckA [Acidobacteriota bacterium]
MERPSPFSLKKSDLPWVVLSLLILVPCLYYPYLHVTQPMDFSLNSDWKVLSVLPCPEPEHCLKVDDQLLTIGPITHEMYLADRTLSVVEPFGGHGDAPVRLLRKGREMMLTIRIRQESGKLPEIPPAAIFPIAFWLMGTVAALFLRPRDERCLVLVLFSYVTAVWFASGLASPLRLGHSAVVFHLVLWIIFPLALHLHLILPSSLMSARWRFWFLAPLYSLALVVTLLDALILLGPFRYAFIWTTVGSLLAPFVLLGLRLFLPLEPADKIANRLMLYGIVLGLGPFFLIFVVMPFWMVRLSDLFEDLRALAPWLLTISVLSVPILPMSYIYAIYKHHVGALEFRANRLVGLYSFSVLALTTYVVTLFLVSSRWAPIRVSYIISVLATSLVFISLAFLLHGRFQALVDRHIFGIRHSPDEVIDLVSERIPTAFDRSALAEVLVQEILPSLLIRQSALHLLERPPEDGLETIYEQGVPPGDPLTVDELHALLEQSGRYLHPQDLASSRFDWVRLVTPLSLQGETIGIWLLGRRDPDDHYPAAEVHLLTTVANQIAPMVENIRLYERAQQEIAQRKAAEEEIRRSEERFRTLFEATLEGIAIVRNGTVLEVNHALLAIFGYAPGELIGRELSDLVSVPETGLDDVPREGHGFQRDGSVVDIEVAGKKYVFQGEDVTVVAIRDIAQRKRNEAENKMLQRQLLLSQKMEAIGRLSAGVAHDFNNCLLAIFGYNDLMLDRYRSDPFLVRNLSGVKEAGQKAAALTKQLLAFARRQPMETRVLELNPVITGLGKMLQRLLGEDIQLVSELGSDLGRVKVDPGQIEQVVVNLAVNARHAMPTGGKLTIRTSAVRAALGNPAPHADVPPGAWLLLSVADTGIGMDAETQARVFEPFFSTKGEGTGLGLSMAYGIVKQSGGHIFVDSSPGAGAVFSIYLPLTQEAGTVLVAAVPGLDDSGSETILLVEDEGEVRRVLHQILVGKGYRVIQAESGDEALAMARMFRGAIHLLLTDVTMPQMKGPELATRLVAERPQTRVLFMSGYNDESLSAEETILQKPFAAQTLTQTIRSILDAEESLPKSATA